MLSLLDLLFIVLTGCDNGVHAPKPVKEKINLNVEKTQLICISSCVSVKKGSYQSFVRRRVGFRSTWRQMQQEIGTSSITQANEEAFQPNKLRGTAPLEKNSILLLIFTTALGSVIQTKTG
jgi:hypothetical protein